ncbi:hypothetical protein [Actinoalloteichus sp. GBA129-24]|uniref:hypothetical protein n=1 Tax=Actinoalloteichus sp. GBA129-24 TaxID=1612551 RepID=UPI00095070EC|nr:hypothetical protein [Actinoalloteichus sp. GBA129-24]APU21639.1 hypothetical protein UA75_18245 [Actinoalloteichus sp. GBA129-24]
MVSGRVVIAAPLVSAVPAHVTPGGSMSLVLVADRTTRSVALASAGRGLAALNSRAARLVCDTVTDPRPVLAVEVAATGRDHQACRVRVVVHHGQVTILLLSGETTVRQWHIARRGALAVALTSAVAHVADPIQVGAPIPAEPPIARQSVSTP